jgi:hypothetical protein
VHAGQTDRDRGGQRLSTGVQVRDGLTDVRDGRRRPVLTGFKVGRRLGTGPTETEHHLEQRFSLRCAHSGAAVGQQRRRTRLGKQIEQLTPIDGHIWEHFVADACHQKICACVEGNGQTRRADAVCPHNMAAVPSR